MGNCVHCRLSLLAARVYSAAMIRRLALTVALLCMLPSILAAAPAHRPPKLIVQITIDALRGDLVDRFSSVLGKGGFGYLIHHGLHFDNAHYQHANTETIVGHTSLATGALPSAHGMVANVWFDRERGRLVYNIEDSRYHLLTADADVDQQREIDPTQKTARVDGRSPANILTSTFSDELAIHTNGGAKIFAVSVKDRAAVSMAGHAGKAFWFSKAKGAFVTSSYYYRAMPSWAQHWNSRHLPKRYAGKSWQLLYQPARYQFGQQDDQPFETALPGFGRTFPHPYGQPTDKYFTTFLTLSPAGDALTLDFAKALIHAEQLGQDDVTDYLSISFSSTDYVGHIFSASSLESEDNLAHLDRTLADLFAYLDRTVGLDRTLIVLSADHGQPEAPGYLQSLGMGNARYFDLAGLDKSTAISAIKRRFHLNKPLIKAYFHPYIYLDHQLIRKHGLALAEVEDAVAAELLKFDGIAYAVSSQRRGQLPDDRISRLVRNNFHANRSGDIYVVFAPNVFINHFDHLTVSSVHGSPWRYDTFVPIYFAGNGLTAAVIHRPVTPYAIAPTLSALIHAAPPSAAIGEPLVEVLR